MYLRLRYFIALGLNLKSVYCQISHCSNLNVYEKYKMFNFINQKKFVSMQIPIVLSYHFKRLSLWATNNNSEIFFVCFTFSSYPIMYQCKIQCSYLCKNSKFLSCPDLLWIGPWKLNTLQIAKSNIADSWQYADRQCDDMYIWPVCPHYKSGYN